MLVGDVGVLAGLARDDALGSAALSLFHPLKFMLASPAENADEIVARLGPEVWVEDKYDGIRCQLHKLGRDVRLYSRDLHDISGGYPEIVEACPRPALGRDPRRRDPRLAGRRRPAVHHAPGPARAQGAVRGDPGRGPRHLRCLRRARAGAGRRRSGRPAARPAAAGTAGPPRSARPPTRRPGWTVRPLVPCGRGRRRRARIRPSSTRAPGATRA